MSYVDEMMAREIPEGDVTQLRALMRLPDDYGEGDASDLPYELKHAYWQWKLIHDRIDGSGLSTIDFKCIGMFAGIGLTKLEGDDQPKTFLELVDAGEVAIGDAVSYLFRRQHVPGYFNGLTKDRRHVRVDDGQGAERQVIPTDVHLDPTREPADLTPASAKREEKASAPQAAAKRGPGRPAKPKQEKEPVAAASSTPSSRPDIHAGQEQDDDGI